MGRIVIAAYRPKPGKAEDLKALVGTHVDRLRERGLVTDRAPVAMEAEDGTVIEVFEWASAEAIDKAHKDPVVLEIWAEFGEACEYVPICETEEGKRVFSEFTPL